MSYIQTDMTQREVELAKRITSLEYALLHAYYRRHTTDVYCSGCEAIDHEIEIIETRNGGNHAVPTSR